jgi:uncharacterized protein with PQ loop repeat
VIFLGIMVIVLQQVRALPQSIRIVWRRDTTGVSVVTWCLVLANIVLWGGYGYLVSDTVLIVNNTISMFAAGAVLVALVIHGATRWWLPVAVGVGTVVSTILLDRVFNAEAVGLVGAVLGIVMFIPQAVKVFRSPTSGVSPLTWFLTVLSSISWIVYAWLADIPSILLAHSILLPTAIVILARVTLWDRVPNPIAAGAENA